MTLSLVFTADLDYVYMTPLCWLFKEGPPPNTSTLSERFHCLFLLLLLLHALELTGFSDLVIPSPCTRALSQQLTDEFSCMPFHPLWGLYCMHILMTLWRSASATWGVIRQWLRQHGKPPHMHLVVSWRSFVSDVTQLLSSQFGLCCMLCRAIDGGWGHNAETLWYGKKRRSALHGERYKRPVLEARHRLRLTSLSLTDWWDYPDIFSFQLKLHYRKDLMLGRSPHFSQGIWAPFCSVLHSFLSFFSSHTQKDEIFFTAFHVLLSAGTAARIPFQRRCSLFATMRDGDAAPCLRALPALN